MAKKNVVIVGAGGISDVWFSPLMAEKVDISAVVDLNIEAAEHKIAQFKLGAEASTDLKEMLDKYNPSFVLDLTVPGAHYSVTSTALQAGYPVLGEKPMADSLANARKMIKLAKETNLIYMVSQSRRWYNAADSVKLSVEAGKIGDLTSIDCDFFAPLHGGKFHTGMDNPLLLDMSIHHFDLARFLSGADPVAVYAHEYNTKGSWFKGDASVCCIFEMSNRVVFNYRGSWTSYGNDTSWNGNWRLNGQTGTLKYEDDKPPFGQYINPAKPNKKMDIRVKSSKMKYEAFHGSLREMLRCLNTGDVPQTNCEDNFKSLSMVFAAIKSAKTGKRVLIEKL